MAQTSDELEGDWLHAVFSVLREEAVAMSADFGLRVKREVDQVAGTRDLHPPSAVALLSSVALETTNMAASLLPGALAALEDDEPKE